MFKLEDVNLKEISVGDIYYHCKKGFGSPRRRLRVDALYTSKGFKGKPDKSLVACTDMATCQPYTPIMVRSFRTNYKKLELTKGERFVYEGGKGTLGGFAQSLYSTIVRADSSNRRKLQKAFPEEVAILNGDGWDSDNIQRKVNMGANTRYYS